ncbi:MAG: hypothetical protein VKN56_10305 [Cyanobacteriota bacterium]|nr:hypothetical protein [Cyanobacteriota bacterium]
MTAARPDPSTTPPLGHPTIEAEMKPLIDALEEIAASHEGDPEALLALLRRLEQLHRSIQDGPFRSSLPSERSSLFRLLQDMELNGGWPYIPRLQLRTFLDLLQQGTPAAHEVDSTTEVAEAA